MTDNEIINIAIKELREAEKPYMMFKDFSFMKDIDSNSSQYKKIRYLLVKSSPFNKHTDHAIKFSETGFEIVNNHKDWFAYKKSLQPKIDYIKWIGVAIAGLSLVWNVYQGITNNNLRNDNRLLHDEIEALEKENAGLKQNMEKLTE